jgi:hypothetical protein
MLAEEKGVVMNLAKFARTGTILMALACMAAATSQAQDRAHPKANLSRLVVVGDSLSAGFQNDSLLDTQQPHGWAAVVASQANVPLALPLIAPPGIPNVLELVSRRARRSSARCPHHGTLVSD